MPISDRASRTSSSLKGLMIAVISFIAIPREGDERIYAISVPIFQDYEKSFVSKIAGESPVLESCVFFALSRPNSARYWCNAGALHRRLHQHEASGGTLDYETICNKKSGTRRLYI